MGEKTTVERVTNGSKVTKKITVCFWFAFLASHREDFYYFWREETVWYREKPSWTGSKKQGVYKFISFLVQNDTTYKKCSETLTWIRDPQLYQHMQCTYTGQRSGLEVPLGQNAPAGQAVQSSTLLFPSLVPYVPAGQGYCVPLHVPSPPKKEQRITLILIKVLKRESNIMPLVLCCC